MSESQYRISHEQRARKLLQKWDGARVALWSYQVSLRILVIRLEKVGIQGNLHINCLGTECITASTKWRDGSFEVEFRWDQDECFVRDWRAGVEIQCGSVTFEENVRPVFLPIE